MARLAEDYDKLADGGASSQRRSPPEAGRPAELAVQRRSEKQKRTGLGREAAGGIGFGNPRRLRSDQSAERTCELENQLSPGQLVFPGRGFLFPNAPNQQVNCCFAPKLSVHRQLAVMLKPRDRRRQR
jgi:hypothetical protein